MTPSEAFDTFAATLVGCRSAVFGAAMAPQSSVEIGGLSPQARRDGSPGHPEGELSLGVEWSWRIEDQTAIRCGSWSEDELWEPALDTLRNARIAGCELLGALPDVVITTDSGVRFLSFSTTDDQPQWHLVDRRDGPARWFSVRDGQLHLGDGTEPSP
jgi:hypothetical protein